MYTLLATFSSATHPRARRRSADQNDCNVSSARSSIMKARKNVDCSRRRARAKPPTGRLPNHLLPLVPHPTSTHGRHHHYHHHHHHSGAQNKSEPHRPRARRGSGAKYRFLCWQPKARASDSAPGPGCARPTSRQRGSRRGLGAFDAVSRATAVCLPLRRAGRRVREAASCEREARAPSSSDGTGWLATYRYRYRSADGHPKPPPSPSLRARVACIWLGPARWLGARGLRDASLCLSRACDCGGV